MGYVHQDLVSNWHWYNVMANAIAGGRVDFSNTGATGAFGGFGVATTGDGVATVTWSADYSGTPHIWGVLDLGGVTSSATTIALNVLQVNGVGPSSAALIGVQMGAATNATPVTIAAVAECMVFGSATGTRHS